MQTFKKAALVLVGIVLGCGGAAVAPMAIGSAAPATGEWRCYRNDGFPDYEEAASNAVPMTQGLNAVARHAPAGTVISTTRDSESRAYVCVKY